MSEGKLAAKIAEVVAEVGYVKKDGRNDFQGYNYTSAEALLAVVRTPLSARKVVLLPSLDRIDEREYTTSKGKASVITTAYVKFTFIDGESGERHECTWAGQGDDPADKGLGKSFTNAIKTFLREAFLIPQGDDPEADTGADERGRDRAPSRSSQSASPPQYASEQQQRLIFGRAKADGIGAQQLANAIRRAANRDELDNEDEATASQQVDFMLKHLPPRLVNPVLEELKKVAEDVPAMVSE